LAAEEAVAAAPSEDLREMLARCVPAARRAEVLLAAARARMAAGLPGEAAALFERAADLGDGSVPAGVEQELRGAWDAAGRGHEIETRARRRAMTSTSPAARADAWTEVAELREKQGDVPGAVDALGEACAADPDPLARWSALERAAEIARDDAAQVRALEQIAVRVSPDGLVTVLKRLARAHGRREDPASAESAWERALAVDPADEEADLAIEAAIVARGDHDRLAAHLSRRAERLGADPARREILRAVRLRRAAILEQRLGRTEDACRELALVLEDRPDNVGALRYLADLLDRQSEYVRSAPLWRRAASAEVDPVERDALELRAARAFRAAGDIPSAFEHANRLSRRSPSNADALEIRLEGARSLGADGELGDALEASALQEDDPRRRADLLLDAARAAVRAGDALRGIDRARRAAAADPDRPAPRLLARELEYRVRGAGAPDEARQTIEELTRIGEPLAPDDAALRAFLLAESLDVVQGGGAGIRELEATRAVIGPHPLLALGLAERLTAQGQYGSAVAAYRAALAGPLLDFRRAPAVALAGTEVAIRAGSEEDARYFLGVAEEHEDCRASAASLRARLTSIAEPGTAFGEVRLYDLEAAVQTARSPHDRAQARLALARGRLEFGDVRGAEPLLWESLADGIVEAGDALAPLLSKSPERASELVRVRWQQVSLEPGDVGRLEALRDAALADDDRVHARAIEHVLRAFDPGAGPLPPPPLAAQPDQTGILALLMRPSMDAAGEAFGLLWEGAMQLFVRDPASYGITGVERVIAGPSSAISGLYEVALRVLGTPRIPLFASRALAGPVTSHAALLAPASVIVNGDLRQETTELRFELGRGIAAALPANVLRRALPLAEGRVVLDALRTAFGSPELGQRVDSRAARLAESFWQIIPARAQRRLQELLPAATLAEYEDLVEAALQSGRRVGMFLAGDFGCAARSLLAEAVRLDPVPSPQALRELCLAVPALADLLRLAVRAEYADARWHAAPPAAPRRTPSSRRFSLF
ncbi:MAG: hypothetical protein JOZ69_16560, partial [Myxococcales bacterium]|nr:hypothetical protein [Myxococcales bacterium]